jgi:AcrR family transcriptional regulator
MSGRQAEAARNDRLIIEAARAVFLDDPNAPISAVAERAGVGIGALYRRYASKEDLLQQLAGDGLKQYLAVVEKALASERDSRSAFVAFMQGSLEASAHSMTARFAGSFTPTEEMNRDGRRSYELTHQLLERAKAAGALRPEIEVGDIAMLFELLQSVRVKDEERTAELRRRYLALILEALQLTSADALPGSAPGWAEIRARYDG